MSMMDSEEELSDADVGITPARRVDLTPLQDAISAMGDDLHAKNSEALQATVRASMERVEEAVEAMTETQKSNASAVTEAVKAATDAGSKAVLAAISRIKMPDVSALGASLSDALLSINRVNERALKMVAESNDRLATAVQRLAELEAREIKLDVKESEKKAPEYDFQMVYGDNGELKRIKAVAMPNRPPESALEAARRAGGGK